MKMMSINASTDFINVKINFICLLDWVRGCPAGKTIFLGVSLRIFPEKIRI